MISLAGYQGHRSIHTRALRVLADGLPGATIDADVTADGRTAASLSDAAEKQPALVAYMASGYLTARVPELGVLDLPFSVDDRDAAHRRLDGAAGSVLRAAVAARTGYRVLAFWDNGFRHVSNRCRAIRGVADCAGLTIRTLDNAIYQDSLRSFGFTPVVTDVRDLVEAVVSGRVDAQENPLTNLIGFGLHAYHPHVSLSGHLFGTALLLCNAAWFDTLNPAVALVLQHAADRATTAQRGFAAEEDAGAVGTLTQAGVQVVSAAELDLEGFRRACEPVRDRVLSTLDPALIAAWR